MEFRISWLTPWLDGPDAKPMGKGHHSALTKLKRRLSSKWQRNRYACIRRAENPTLLGKSPRRGYLFPSTMDLEIPNYHRCRRKRRQAIIDDLRRQEEVEWDDDVGMDSHRVNGAYHLTETKPGFWTLKVGDLSNWYQKDLERLILYGPCEKSTSSSVLASSEE